MFAQEDAGKHQADKGAATGQHVQLPDRRFARIEGGGQGVRFALVANIDEPQLVEDRQQQFVLLRYRTFAVAVAGVVDHQEPDAGAFCPVGIERLVGTDEQAAVRGALHGLGDDL